MDEEDSLDDDMFETHQRVSSCQTQYDQNLQSLTIGQPAESMKWSVIQDPVHGSIRLPLYLMQIINTPYFQRLRNLH